MRSQRLRAILPFAVAVICAALAMSRVHQRVLWLVLAIIFIVVGLRWRRAGPPPAG